MRNPIWTIPVLMTFCTMGPDADTWRQKIEPMIESNPAQAEQEMLAALEHKHLKGEAALLLTRLYIDQENYNGAVKYGKQASKLLKDRAEAHLAYASAINMKMSVNTAFAMGNAGTYRKALDKALALDPDNLDAVLQRIGFLANAPAIAGGSLKKAKEQADELKDRNERYHLIAWSIIYRKEDDNTKLAETYDKLLVITPDNTDYMFRLAMIHVEEGRNEEALPLLEKVYASKDPDHLWESTYHYGRVLVITEKDIAAAAKLFESYVAEAPENDDDLPPKSAAYWRLGDAQEKLGNIEAARTAYEKSLELDPKDKDSQAALERLNKASS
jgi:tetratricopeptide (TPR) repeat protein